jgi:D-alanyl-D-alanine dipeptidase
MKKSILILTILLTTSQAELLKSFNYIQEKIPNIELELRYYGENNFIGQTIDGYFAPRAILSSKATYALSQVQKELENFGLGLKVFDAYRPQKAVDHFVRWGRDLKDKKMKKEYYPFVEKKNLFKEGYIAKKSGHSRGSTVDLTLIDLKSKEELDMGSSFDFFGELSSVQYTNITAQQRANRMLLNFVMLKSGFKSYAQEWWHFTLKDEPFKKTYFNFNVQ